LFIGSDNVGGYQVNQLYVTDNDNISPHSLTKSLDRNINSATWSSSGKHIYFNYIDKSIMKIARVDMQGNVEEIASGLGGTAIGRPYTSGDYSLADNNTVAFVSGSTSSPAEVATIEKKKTRYLTQLNANLLKTVEMGEVEEIWYPSSVDGQKIHGWIVKPAGFDHTKKHPLILEIHGGPYTSYAAEFSAEIQLYAAAGYVVLYTNPRGSTSYGTKFSREIYKAYPGQDYDDLMSGVDEVISRGYIDADNLFVTGGSGGGVLTAWIVGKTNRFRAAVVAKPVINWYAFTLTSDIGSFFWKINFDKMPWEDPMAYHKLSPISLVGQVSTPTMLLTGEVDYRTPMSESEQYYQALKILGVDSMLVRLPGTSHSIARRPSNLLRKAAYILGWFDKYRTGDRDGN
jgi:acylaminoacyl-peptidase